MAAFYRFFLYVRQSRDEKVRCGILILETITYLHFSSQSSPKVPFLIISFCDGSRRASFKCPLIETTLKTLFRSFKTQSDFYQFA